MRGWHPTRPMTSQFIQYLGMNRIKEPLCHNRSTLRGGVVTKKRPGWDWDTGESIARHVACASCRLSGPVVLDKPNESTVTRSHGFHVIDGQRRNLAAPLRTGHSGSYGIIVTDNGKAQ